MMANESTPVRAGAVNVPYGHVIGNEKWKGSQIAQGIQGKNLVDEGQTSKNRKYCIELCCCFLKS